MSTSALASPATLIRVEFQNDVLTNIGTSPQLFYTVPADADFVDLDVYSTNRTGVTTFMYYSWTTNVNTSFGTTTNLSNEDGFINSIGRFYPGDTIYLRTNTGTGFRAAYVASVYRGSE